MKTEIIKHEVEAGNYVIVKAIDSADASIAAQDYLDDLPDNDTYEYEAKAALETSEENTFRVDYNVYDR